MIGLILGFVFLVLSVASGLYYVSELVEEHSEPTRRFLTRFIYAIIVVLLLLCIFDGFLWKLTAVLILLHWVYLQNLAKFPYVLFTLPVFLALCALVFVNHFLWFNHFHHPYIPPIEVRLRHDYEPPYIPLFVEICLFFGLCIWFVPFALFVSLSAHDNLLPHHMEATNSSDKKKTNGLAKVVVTRVRDWIYATARLLGWELDPHRDRIV